MLRSGATMGGNRRGASTSRLRIQRKSTPRSTSTACAHWLTPGPIGGATVTALEQALKDYIAISAVVLDSNSGNRRVCLRNFVDVSPTLKAASYITTNLALRWATQPAKAQPATWAWRLGMVRRFAIWYSATEPRTEIPPAGLLPHRHRRKPPHIYSDEEIDRNYSAERNNFHRRKGLRARTFTHSLRSVW